MRKYLEQYQLPADSLWMAILLSTYLTVFLNSHLWHELYQSQTGFPIAEKWEFLVSMGFVVWALQAILLSFFFWRKPSKLFAIVILLSAVAANHFSENFGVFFDTTMLQNIFETHQLEAQELLTVSLLFDYLKHIPFIVFLIFLIDIEDGPAIKSIAVKLIFTIGLLIISAAILVTNFKNFSSTFRNHREIRNLIIPSSYFLATSKLMLGAAHSAQKTKDVIDTHAVIGALQKEKKILVVLVVGETVRSQNWGLSGYSRNTTPELSRLPVVNYPYAISCGTNTKTSLPCMFSSYGRAGYDEDAIKNSESILNLLSKLQVHVTWIDNQSGCKGACDHVNFHEASEFDNKNYCKGSGNCFDEVLINALKNTISTQEKHQLIVLHQIGNHGPAYFERYPKNYERFSPACSTSDLTQCKNAEITNAYDNAIIYTDSILAKMIGDLSRIEDREVYFMYVSDHGESLGEDNIYLHGFPYAIAPAFQTHAAMLMHFSGLAKNFRNCAAAGADQPVSHDHVYHTLLRIFGIETKTFKKEYDLLKNCHDL